MTRTTAKSLSAAESTTRPSPLELLREVSTWPRTGSAKTVMSCVEGVNGSNECLPRQGCRLGSPGSRTVTIRTNAAIGSPALSRWDVQAPRMAVHLRTV
jgi:hypothetical protein